MSTRISGGRQFELLGPNSRRVRRLLLKIFAGSLIGVGLLLLAPGVGFLGAAPVPRG